MVPITLTTTGSDTLSATLLRQAEARRDEPFVVFEDDHGGVRQRTYGETVDRAARTAGLLSRLGIAKGDTFHVHLPNCPEFYDCWFGGALLGAIMVPTNPLATSDELAYIIDHAGCRASVTQPDLYQTMAKAREHTPGLEHVLLARTAAAQDDALAFGDEVGRADPAPPAAVAATDVAGILYTSGTTSRPKGVLVTNANYLFVGEAVAEHVRLRPDDRMMIVLPLFHGNAQYYSTMSALVTGASIALTERFSASRWSAQAARHEATVASLFAAPIRMLLAQPPQGHDADNRLRLTLFAQNVTSEQLEEFERRFGTPLVQLYGMTETMAPPTMNPVYGERRNLSIGRPGLRARVRIVDDGGRDVPAGEVGQLLVGGEPGHTLMAGYLNQPEATAETMRDSWLHTGDNVYADQDGYLHFVDRSKDMIKRAGENVATGEVERVVNEHPAVFESAAIGVPDPVRDEAVKMFVVLGEGAETTEDDLIAWCAERLSKFKVPSEVEFVQELPRTSVGKIQKHLLRERAQDPDRAEPPVSDEEKGNTDG